MAKSSLNMEKIQKKSFLKCFLTNIILLFVITTTTSAESICSLHDHYEEHDFLRCLKYQQNLESLISKVVFSQENSSYLSILESSVGNLWPSSHFPSKPRFIITPEHESQIQATIYCAKKTGIQIRVRSGGHDYEGLSYVSDEIDTPFVIVDLRKLNSIIFIYNEKEQEQEYNHTTTATARIQAGATIGELYYAIAKESNSLAGVCPTVGVGGHFSGGGYSMMSRKFGMAAEHIILILDRKSMGEDLFWAIRGGGGASFGIITEWTVKLLTVPEKVTVFSVPKTLEQNVTELVHRWQYIADKIDERLLIRIFVTTSINNTDIEITKTDIVASFTALFLGRSDELLKLMQQSFPELGLTKDDCQEMSWLQSTLYFADLPIDQPKTLLNRTPEIKISFKGKSDYIEQPISRTDLEEIWKIMLENVGRVQLQFSPYGGRLNELSESAFPFPHRAGNIFILHYAVGWTEEENNSVDVRQNINWTRKYSYMTKLVSKSPRGAYLNYRDLDIGANNIDGSTSYEQARIWGVKYFKNNFDRLVQVKTQVDPTNFFRNEQSIPPVPYCKKQD